MENIISKNLDIAENQRTFTDGSKRVVVVLESVAVGQGDAFEVQPDHDAWVVGDESCIAFDFKCM